MKTIIGLFFFLVLLISNVSHAGTQVLGFEINKSTFNEVKEKLSKQTKVVDAGLSKYSNGPVIATNGDIYGVDGLNMVIFAFDSQKRLVAVSMEIEKNNGLERFDSLFEMIAAKKYKLISKRRPFVGDAYAKFTTPDAEIEINAPHLSFKMAVVYATKEFMQTSRTQRTEEAAEKKQKESANF